MKMTICKHIWGFIFLNWVLADVDTSAAVSASAQGTLNQLLLGKEVRALLDLPATKEGLDIYFVPPEGRRTDERGLDLRDLTKWLKEKGIGIEAKEWEIITNVKFGGDKVALHLGGGGQGCRGSKHAGKVGPTFKRRVGSLG